MPVAGSRPAATHPPPPLPPLLPLSLSRPCVCNPSGWLVAPLKISALADAYDVYVEYKMRNVLPNNCQPIIHSNRRHVRVIIGFAIYPRGFPRLVARRSKPVERNEDHGRRRRAKEHWGGQGGTSRNEEYRNRRDRSSKCGVSRGEGGRNRWRGNPELIVGHYQKNYRTVKFTLRPRSKHLRLVKTLWNGMEESDRGGGLASGRKIKKKKKKKEKKLRASTRANRTNKQSNGKK